MVDGIILRGLETRRPIEIIYLNKDGKLSQRVVTVVELNDTYVKAYCHLRRCSRSFKLENILSAAPFKKKYRKHAI